MWPLFNNLPSKYTFSVPDKIIKNLSPPEPCNLYGPNDNFGENGHVIPSLMRKFHKDAVVDVWGDGLARREFLYVDDLAKAVVMLMEKYNYDDLHDGVINVGFGEEISIWDLRRIISNTLDIYKFINFDLTKPSGVRSKLMDSSRIRALGWKPETSLKRGIEKTYEDYLSTLQE